MHRRSSTTTGQEGDELTGLSVRELKALARERSIPTEDCFGKESLLARVMNPPPVPPAETASATEPAAGAGAGEQQQQQQQNDDGDEEAALAVALEELKSSSVRELKTLIFRADLSSRGLFEKEEILAQAARAKVKLDAKTKDLPDDARKYIEDLGVQFFGRLSCPYCVDALKVLTARGVTDEALLARSAAAGSSEVIATVMRDVEKDPSAGADMQRLSGSGGGGVPFFYSAKTGKSAAGWVPGAEDLEWLVQKLS